jgi:4-hydroxy-3-polyprenylbenzoate decarboxylase
MNKIIIAIGGSSGSIYANRLLTKLSSVKNVEVGVVVSANAKINWEIEIGEFKNADFPFKFYDNKDFFAPFASGSAKYETMVICPCSMGLIGRIASGISDDLITRAADVILKERRKLIIVPRETPYSLIHLRNMTFLTEAGAIICPASPSFYSKPNTLQEIIDTVIYRVIDLMGIEQNTYRWGIDGR